MPFNPAPNTWLANWSEDGTNIAVPLATFPELTAAEADGATGDIRKVLYALCEKLADEWAAKPAADRPARMQINRSSSLNSTTGQITYTYTLSFVTTPAGIEVAPE